MPGKYLDVSWKCRSGSTVSIDVDRSMPWSNCVYRDRTLELRFRNRSIPETKVSVPKSWMLTWIGSTQRVQRPKGKAGRSKLDTSVGRQRLECSLGLIVGNRTQ